LAADFNGDGKDDLVNLYANQAGNTRAWLHLANGRRFENQSHLQTLSRFYDTQHWFAGDYDGDGLADLTKVFGQDV
jgi:hypothetical protein